MEKIIITIARQYGSGGRTVGKMLAERLQIPYYDREIISMASEDSGINAALFQDEKKVHSLRALLTGGYHSNKLLFPESAGFTKDDNLFTYQAKIIRQLAEEGSCVLIGRCADHVLKEMPGMVRVFVHAPADFCLREAMKVNSQPENEVVKLIAETDTTELVIISTIPEKNGSMPWIMISLDSSRLGFDGTVEAILAYIEVRKKSDPQMQD